ncbi:MAG: hypothetical protein HOV80_21975 [Polyangiaceae bacterium]|nr:hypothetical protein [Polyangiaceae bacterium]
MVTLVVLLALGMFGALLGGLVFGGVGGLIGFVAGIAGPPTLVALVAAVDSRLFAGPALDTVPCPCGELASRFERRAVGYVQVCACARMLRRERGRIFLVGPSGALVPYLRWHFWRGWVPVSGRNAAAEPYR